jgi:hypothetical protein
MKITGVRTRLYEFTAGRGLGDANLPTGSNRGNGLAVFVDTDQGIPGVTTGSPGARAAIHGLAESLLVGQDSVCGLQVRVQAMAAKVRDFEMGPDGLSAAKLTSVWLDG